MLHKKCGFTHSLIFFIILLILLITRVSHFLFANHEYAQTRVNIFKIDINHPQGLGEAVGYLLLEDTKYGLLITPFLYGMTEGMHALHIHDEPTCVPGKSGGHWDPYNTGKYLGPYLDSGALGDLPNIYVAADGRATLPVLAPRINLKAIGKRSMMIHNHADHYHGPNSTIHKHTMAKMPENPKMYCGIKND